MHRVFFDWNVPLQNLPLFIKGAEMTLLITLVVCIFEVLIGAIFGYIRYAKKPYPLYALVTAYVEFFRNTPLLVQIYFIFYGFPAIGITLPGVVAGTVALIVCNAAYTTEIFRSGIQSIGKGQWEAAKCICLTKKQTFLDVIFPQAMRTIFPALSNQFIMTLLASSLISALNVNELTNVTVVLAAHTFRVTESYVFAIVIYYIMTLALSSGLKFVNKKYFPSVSTKGE